MRLKHQATAADKWRVALRQVERHFPPELPPLLFLTDPVRVPDPAKALSALPQGTGVIYRHFGAEDRIETAMRLAEICTARQLTLLIAADPALALQTGAAGVHWPEARLSEARHWRHRFEIQTASAHSRPALARADRAGMSAVLVSKVFHSASSSVAPVIGAAKLRRLARLSRIPVYALGGVTAKSALRVASVAALAAIEGLAT